MAQIYKITNTVNAKVYIGKTEQCFNKRFKQHCRDSRKKRCEKRPLYNAMQKYGIDKFKVELLLETDNPELEEIRLIEEHGSYGEKGYNATPGGDGRRYLTLEDDEVVKTYLQEVGNTLGNVADKYGVCVDTIRTILKTQGVHINPNKNKTSKTVKQYTKTNEFIAIYSSIMEAAKAIGVKDGSHIGSCIKGRRKSAYGYIWK